MPKIARKHKYHLNRKKLFELDGLRLWLDTVEGAKGALPGAVLELMRRRTGTRSKWEVCWSGIVRIEAWGATVETTKPASK